MSRNVSLACFGCVDFANNERTLAYHAWACAQGKYANGCVPRLNWLCYCSSDNVAPDDVFTDPVTDSACWYDPLIPESADFLGVIVNRVTGSRASTFKRDVVDGATQGSILQRPALRGKQLAFEVYLLATTCAGMDYGIEWLRRVLEDTSGCSTGSNCDSCEGQELLLRMHCPDDVTNPDDDGLHRFISAGIIDGLSLVDDDFPMGKRCCCVMQKFTFTVATESAYSFARSADDTCSSYTPDGFQRCWFLDCEEATPTECCPFCFDASCDRCITDPACDCLPPLVIEPETLESSCFVQPMCRTITACCISDVPHGYDTALKISLFSGYDPENLVFSRYGARNVVVRVFENPNGYDCPVDDATYEALTGSVTPCAEFAVSWIPPASRLVFDGTKERVQLFCDGVCHDHLKRVDVLSGSMFPLVTRCRPVVVVAEWDCLNMTDNGASPAMPSSMTVETVRRFRV